MIQVTRQKAPVPKGINILDGKKNQHHNDWHEKGQCKYHTPLSLFLHNL